MNFSEIVMAIDEQIAMLQQVRSLLSEASAVERNTEKVVAALKPGKSTGKRTMSAEGRARIAAAQKKRWALKQQTAEEPDAKRSAPAKKVAKAV